MKQKTGRKLLSFLLTLAMLFSLVPGMSLTAYADNEKAYAAYDVTTDTNKTKSGDALAALQVTFNGKPWYIIEDNSTSATEGMLTLLAADTSFGTSAFHNPEEGNEYSTSIVKGVLDALTEDGGAFKNAAGAIKDTDNGKLYLLSTEEANALSSNVRIMPFTGNSYLTYSQWWLRSPSTESNMPNFVALVFGDNGALNSYGDYNFSEFGVRPALQLDLSKVTFDSDTKTFTVGSATAVIEYPLWVGGVQVTSANAGNIDGNNKATYDAETNTLTLNGYDSNTPHEWTFDSYPDDKYSAIIYSEHDLVINIVGNNSITNNTKTYESRGIYTKGNLTITGEGSITVVSEGKYTNKSDIGINAIQGDVTISSGTVSSTGGGGGIIAEKNVIINGSSIVNATSSADVSYCILAAGGAVTISGNSNVTTTGAIGSYADNVTINGGTVSANGYRYGIFADDGVVTISGGAVTATGNTQAISGEIKNAIAGTGWTDKEGTEGKAAIAVSTEGQSLSYKKVQFPAPVAVTGVSLNPNVVTLTVGDDAVALTATVEPNNATDKKVKWSTSGSGVKLYTDEACTTEVDTDATDKLTVYAKGESAGSATVTATSNADSSKSASCDVTVNAQTVTAGVSINIKNDDLYADDERIVGSYNGEEATFFTTGTVLTNNTGKTLWISKPTDDINSPTWQLSNGESCTLDGNYYTVTADSGYSISTIVFYNFVPVTGIEFTSSKPLSVAVGEEKYVLARTIPANATRNKVSYTSSNEEIAKITEKYYGSEYYVTGVSVGTATITATSVSDPTKTTTYTVTVTSASAPATVKTAPTAKALTYTGTAQELVTAGEADGGRMYYAVTTENKAPTDESLYTTFIPTGTNAGTYYVWYKVIGDENHNDTDAAKLKVSIAKANPAYTVPTGLTAVYGDTLSDVKLPAGWTWADATQSVGNAGINTFKANYVPTDKTNYNSVENVDVTVIVSKGNGSVAIAPAITAWTSDSVCAEAVNGQEYVIVKKGETPDWSKAVTPDEEVIKFAGLTPATEYTIYTRVKETGNTLASEPKKVDVLTSLNGWETRGEPKTGETITIIPDPENAEGLTWQWYYAEENEEGTVVKCEAIEGETGSSYVVKEGDVGKYLYFVISKGGKELETGYAGPIKIAINVTVALEDWAYGEAPNTPVVTGNIGNGKVSFTYAKKGSEDPESETVPTLPGSYTVYAYIEEIGDYAFGYAQADFTITKGTPEVTAPTAKDLTYNDSAQELVNAGSVKDGTMKYAVTTVNQEPDAKAYTFDNKSLPKATDAGIYYVWYKVVGDENHNDTEAACVNVEIKKAEQNKPEGLEVVNVSAEGAKGGEITGVSDTMEYSVDKGTTWKVVPANAVKIDGLAAGEVLVRYVETDDKNASPAATVVVGVASRTEGEVKFKPDADGTNIKDKAITGVDDSPNESLDEFAKTQKEVGKDVKVEVEITPVKEDKVTAESVTETKKVVDDVFKGINKEKVVTEYLEIDVAKYVNNERENDTISDTNKPIEIPLKYNTTKGNPVVIRTHGGIAKAFGKLRSRPAKKDYKDAMFYIDLENEILYIYSQYFSDFAIVYATETTYNVGFVSGTSENLSPLVVAEGGKVTLPTVPKNDGYAFDGWYKDESYTTAWNDGDTVNADITLYAKWNKSVSGVSVSPSEVKFTKAGETSQIKVTVTPEDAANTKVTYKSSDTKVATVDANGKITAVANGTSTITVTTEDGAKTATVKVTVAIPDVPKQGTSEQTTTEQPVQEPTKEEKAEISMNAGLKINQTGSKINIKWGKVKEADGYDVYVAYCGKKFGKAVRTVNKNNTTSVTVKKINGKKINLKKNYKVYVAAYKMTEGKKEILAKTITGHVVGRKNTKYSNAKKITLSKSKYSVKVGRTVKVKAKTVLVDKNKKQLSDGHAKEFRYATSNKNIATVDKNGKVKGIDKGTCTIYVYARNGYAKTVKVTVK